jgi:hypothetical protein
MNTALGNNPFKEPVFIAVFQIPVVHSKSQYWFSFSFVP